jgi:hypothetical protein
LALQARIGFLIECADDPRWGVVEVYDHPQPPARLREVGAIEPLAIGTPIILSVVRPRDGAENRFHVVEQPGVKAFGEMRV